MSMTNCPNCGSAKDPQISVCPFCGTSYFDLTDIDLGKRSAPALVRFKYNNTIFSMKAFVRMAEFTITPNYLEVTSLNDRRTFVHHSDDISANIEFVCAGGVESDVAFTVERR